MVRSRMFAGLTVTAAVVAGGIGGAVIGVPGLSGAQVFSAATSPGSTKVVPRGAPLLDAAAKTLHLTTQQLLDKLSDGKTTIADIAKQQNVGVNTVIDAMASADRDRISQIVNNPWPQPGKDGPGFRFGRGGPDGPHFGIRGGAPLDAVAKALGISTKDLLTDLGKGQSIADIAKAKKLDVNTVITTLVDDASKRIDQAKTDGHLTQSQADDLKAKLKAAITDFVNNGFPKLGGHFGFARPDGRLGFGFGLGGAPMPPIDAPLQ